MIWLFYYFLIYVFVAGMRVTALWNKKARLWISGRDDWEGQLNRLPSKINYRIWFHVSSLGEFEQARPVIEKLRQKQNDLEIILTFFSPSGYTIRSAYPNAFVFYLPADLPGNALKWIDTVKPDFAVFVKYDLWPGFLRGLEKRNIPAILVSAYWAPTRKFASWNLPPTSSLLRGFRHIFLQEGSDITYFRNKGFEYLSLAGDTRIDRSLELPAETAAKIPGHLLTWPPFDLVAGSTWPADEKLIIEVLVEMNLKLLIAPHDTSPENIRRLINSFPFPVARLSSHHQGDPMPSVLIIDSIGLLAYMYSLGRMAYIGGGFGRGIHNTLEPMAHGKPLIFGPAYEKFPEAVDMVGKKAAIPVRDSKALAGAISYFNHPGNAEKAGSIARAYLENHRGASDKVVNYLLESIPFGQRL